MLDYSKRKCYGFVKNNNGEFIINEIEAQNVKLIFECFLNGMSLSEISKELHSREISSPSGKETWSRKVLSNTLSNEKYHLYGIISDSDFALVQKQKASRIISNYSASEEVQVVTEKESIKQKAVDNILEDNVTLLKHVGFYKQGTKCILRKNLIEMYFNTRTKNRIMQSSIKLFKFIMRWYLLEKTVLLC